MVSETGTEAVCGGVRVATGDWVVADLDGIVFVPQALLAEVLEAAEQKRRAEQALLEAVAAGRSLKDAVESIGTL